MLNRANTIAAAAALAGALAFSAVPASAEHGRNAAAAAGVIGGAAVGAAIAGSAAQQPRRYEAYDDDGAERCHIERRRVMVDEDTYRVQRVRVCE